MLSDVVVLTDEEKRGLVDAMILLKSLTYIHKSSEQIIDELQASLIKVNLIAKINKECAS